MAEVEAPAAALPAALDEGASILDLPASAAAAVVEQVPQAILDGGQQQGAAGQLKASTPPLSKQPSALSSKLNSLKERRSQQPPLPAAGLISAAPADSTDAEAPVQAAQPAGPGQKSSQDTATGLNSPSKVPTGAVATATGPSPHSKIPSSSPQRPPRGVSAVEKPAASNEAAQGSPAQGAVWSTYNRMQARAKSSPTVSGPTDEERAKRRQWALEKRKKEEERLRAEAEKRTQDEARKREDHEARLEACRARVRERIAKQHELQSKLAAERTAADAKARSGISRFKGKPLHEKLQEDYERVRQAEEEAKRAAYEEEARTKHVRPRQIITGEVVVKPSQSPMRQRDASPGRHTSTGKQRPAIAGAPFSAGRHSVPGAAPNDELHDDIPEEIVSPSAEARKERPQKPRKQGVTLYSTRQKTTQQTPVLAPRLMERAASPFIFDSHAMPTNVPDQMQFWPSQTTKVAAEALVVDNKGMPTTEGIQDAAIGEAVAAEAYPEDFEPTGEGQAAESPAAAEAAAVEGVAALPNASEPEKPVEEGMEATFALPAVEQDGVAPAPTPNTTDLSTLVEEPISQEQAAVSAVSETAADTAVETPADVVTTPEEAPFQAEEVSIPTEALPAAAAAEADVVTADTPVIVEPTSEPVSEAGTEQQQPAAEQEPTSTAADVAAAEVEAPVTQAGEPVQNPVAEDSSAENAQLAADAPVSEQVGEAEEAAVDGVTSVEEEVAALPETEAVSNDSPAPVTTQESASAATEPETQSTDAAPEASTEADKPAADETTEAAVDPTAVVANEAAAVETTTAEEVAAVSELTDEVAHQEEQPAEAAQVTTDEQPSAVEEPAAPAEPTAE